jgi:PAS domain S-box-containing protein
MENLYDAIKFYQIWDLPMDLNKPFPSIQKSENTVSVGALVSFLGAFEQAPIGIIAIDIPDSRIVFSNTEAERITGVAKHQMAGRCSGDLYADPKTRWACRYTDKRLYSLEKLPSFKAILQGATAKNQEMRIRQPGGKELWVINAAAPIFDKQGGIIAVVTFLSDIDENKVKVKKLQKHKEYLDYALTASEEGLWDWDLDTDQGYLSPRYYEMLGYKNGEFPGSGVIWETMLHPDDKPKALQDLTDFVTNKQKIYKSTYRIRARDNSYRWIQSKAIVADRKENGKPLRLVGTHLDITRRKEMEQRLQRSHDVLGKEVKKRTRDLIETNKKLETILNTSSESIWVCDGKGTVLSINKASERLLDVTAKDVVGKNVASLVNQGFMDRSVTLEVIATRRQVSMMQYVAKTKKYLLVTGTPVIADDGTISMVISNERDLTRLNELREELQQARNVSNTYKKELTELNLLELREQDIIAESQEMQQILKTALKLATLDVSTILVMGESGTGKGLLTKFIHARGKRKKGPFVQINCAALPESLLEAELFGYEKGAFTGAREQGKVGLFEMAEGGTLFLDEIGELALPLQAKLLKCLDEREIMRLGGLKPIKIRCTVIAATNINLSKAVGSKTFRQDLFFRLNTFTIHMPPLRKRPEDIFEMVHFFLAKYQKVYGVKRRISSRAMAKLLACKFPGNARELKNTIKKAVVMSERTLIDEFIVPDTRQERDDSRPAPIPIKGDMSRQVLDYEKNLMVQGLSKCKTTRSLAACLGLSQSAVVRKLKKHQLTDSLSRSGPKKHAS